MFAFRPDGMPLRIALRIAARDAARLRSRRRVTGRVTIVGQREDGRTTVI